MTAFEPAPIRRTKAQREVSKKAYSKPKRVVEQSKPGAAYEPYVPPKPNHRGSR